ncbi:MAG: DUF4112 domain-containing protein [Nevskiales bacterium]|nr:DUF4112 domain-containing protein [Nevskiales bacterium]
MAALSEGPSGPEADAGARAAAAQTRERVRRLARLLDSAVGIPGTRWRFGVDALIGLIPVVGDVAGLLLGAYFFFEGLRIRAPRSVLLRMAANIVFDMLVGLLPVLGDLADFAFQSNARNARLLDAHLDTLLTEPPRDSAPRTRRRVWVLLAILALVLAVLGWRAGGFPR